MPLPPHLTFLVAATRAASDGAFRSALRASPTHAIRSLHRAISGGPQLTSKQIEHLAALAWVTVPPSSASRKRLAIPSFLGATGSRISAYDLLPK